MTITNTSVKKRSRIARAAAAVAVVCVSAAFAPVSAFVPLAPASLSTTHHGSIAHESTRTTLRYMSLEQVSDFYQNFPLQSAVLTCGVKASVADTIAQVKPQIEENNNNNNNNSDIPSDMDSHETLTASHLTSKIEQPTKQKNRIDWQARRNLAYVLYGGIFVGLMSHVEYSYVFPFLFGDEKSVAILTEKVFFDNLIAAPIMWLPPAYFIKAWVYGSDDDDSGKGILAEGLEKYLVDVKENNLLWQYWAIWFPAQTVSFSVVPDHLRVAFMASISFFWFILFSTVSSQGDAEDVSSSSTH